MSNPIIKPLERLPARLSESSRNAVTRNFLQLAQLDCADRIRNPRSPSKCPLVVTYVSSAGKKEILPLDEALRAEWVSFKGTFPTELELVANPDMTGYFELNGPDAWVTRALNRSGT